MEQAAGRAVREGEGAGVICVDGRDSCVHSVASTLLLLRDRLPYGLVLRQPVKKLWA